MSDSPNLTGSDRRYLRGLAHGLRPLVHVGKEGVTPGVVASIDHQLETHELLKVRLLDPGDKRATGAEIARAARAELVGIVGHLVVLYRPASEAARRRIELPARRDQGSRSG